MRKTPHSCWKVDAFRRTKSLSSAPPRRHLAGGCPALQTLLASGLWLWRYRRMPGESPMVVPVPAGGLGVHPVGLKGASVPPGRPLPSAGCSLSELRCPPAGRHASVRPRPGRPHGPPGALLSELPRGRRPCPRDRGVPPAHGERSGSGTDGARRRLKLELRKLRKGGKGAASFPPPRKRRSPPGRRVPSVREFVASWSNALSLPCPPWRSS
jgi:hypothetical protein